MMASTFLFATLAGLVQAESNPASSASKPKAKTDSSVLFIRAKTIETMAGEAIVNGAILVKDGKIVAIGPTLAAPSDAQTLDADFVTPGLVDANCSVGERYAGTEESAEITGGVRALDNLDLESSEFQRLVGEGVTTLFAPPSNRNVIGGVASVLKSYPIGRPTILNPSAALKGSLSSETTIGNFTPRGSGIPQSFHVRRPGSRPGAVMEMRIALLNAANMVGKSGIVPVDWKPIVDVLEARSAMRIHASTLGEIRSALRVAQEFGIENLTIDGAAEAHRCMNDLVRSRVKVVLQPHAIDPMGGINGVGRRIDFSDEVIAQDLLARLNAAGIPVALSSYDGRDNLITQARIAYRYGAARDVALGAVTRAAAEVLGVADRVGTIAVGKDADFALWTGDPLEWSTQIKATVVDGKVTKPTAIKK